MSGNRVTCKQRKFQDWENISWKSCGTTHKGNAGDINNIYSKDKSYGRKKEEVCFQISCKLRQVITASTTRKNSRILESYKGGSTPTNYSSVNCPTLRRVSIEKIDFNKFKISSRIIR